MRFLEKQFIIAFTVVLMAGVFLTLQYLPTVRKAKAYKVENLRLVTENSHAHAQLDELPTIFELIAKAKEDVGDYDAKIPHGRSHGAFLQQIANIMQKHELKELVIQPGSEVKMSKFSRIPILIRCNGKMSQIFKFFKSLESFDRIIKIEDVSFKNSEDYNGQMSLEMKANIFYRVKQ